MTRYPKYKKTGISWLPEIPEEWEMRRVASCLSVKDAPSAPNEELLSVFLDRGVIPFSSGGEKRANATSKDLSKYQLVDVNDFVMNNQQAWRGSVGVSNYRGIVSPAYFVIRMDPCFDPVYANIALRSKPFVRLYELCSRGVGSIQRNLIWNMFKQRHIPLPTLREQKNIAAFLDEKCGKIDKVVAEKEKQIELLKELKQTEIADAVTRGISGAPLVASGIPWLPKIPKGWEVERVGAFFNDDVDSNKDFAYKRAFKFNYGKLVPKNEIGEPDEYRDIYVKYSILKQGDIVINGLNLNYDFVSQRVACAPSDGIITSAYIVCRPRKNTNYQYFTWLLKSMDNKKMFHGMGKGIRLTLSFSEVRKQLIPVPPLAEQKQIVEYIEKKVAEIDAAVKGLEDEVAALKEYKQRLISDVVTGQVKV